MSNAVLTLHFRNEETLRNLEQAAEALGVSKDELAESAIERELALGANLESRLVRTLDRLKSLGSGNLERDIQEFARSEVDFEDPLLSRYAETPDAHGIGALFGYPVERG